ncbi:MAG TPA: 3-hydroxyacyl-CoA dehydrogenase NAD-binding domain-containing protein [Steroidobacteraceae bacterium]|nr:3-hydroxyacyl-CoA dehydrogenase NAD-binding domain-containing protein [Steroidobacteraceae bacterium]
MQPAANVDSSTPYWTLRIDEDRVAWLTFDVPNSSANSLSRPAMLGLNAQLDVLQESPPRALIVQSGKKSGFVAGADIKEFITLTSPEVAYELVRTAQKVLDRLEALPYPTVAAINGFALGGGLELALACRYRVAADDPKVSFGFPEVMLGIHPGFGGTVRAVRCIGSLAAMDLILTGRSLRVQQALDVGLIDAIALSDQLAVAAKALALRTPPVHSPGFKAWLTSLPFIRPLLASQMEKMAAKRAPRKHYPAPYAAIDLWRKYGAKSDAAYDAEAWSIAHLFCTPTSRGLVRVFLLQDRLKGLAGKSATKLERAHVIGAGVMGGDIASWCAAHGLSTTLQDLKIEFVNKALDRAKTFFDKRLRDPKQRAEAGARLQADVEGTGIAQADVVIEAVLEDANIKRSLYAAVEPKLKPTAILASNTSSIALEELTAKLIDPSRFVGIHFFNPVAQMQLVEIVSGAKTSANARQAAIAFVRQIDKLPLPCRSAPGFVVNRVLFPYLIEAMLAAEEGIALPLIDKVAVDFGMPMGPIELADVVGLDVAMHVGKILADAFGKPTPSAVQALVKDGKLGRKSNQGFYFWKDGKAEKPELPARPAPEDLQDRLILPLINESVAVLREQVVEDTDLLDAGVIFGTGFAPFTGGPLNYARNRGFDACVARLEQLEKRYGPRFKPDPGWRTLATLKETAKAL